MGSAIFLYVLAVWFFLPFTIFPNPSRWFGLTWAVWIASQIIILYVLDKLKRRREKEGKTFAWFTFYISSTIIMLLVSFLVPTVIGGIKGVTVSNSTKAAQEEIKTKLEAELPELINHFDKRIEAKVNVEQTAPEVSSKLFEAKSSTQDYYGNLIKVEAEVVPPYGYMAPANVQKLYQEIYNKIIKLEAACPNYVLCKDAWHEYENDEYVNVKEIRKGIILYLECKGCRYKAESNSDLKSSRPDSYAYTVTDEISGTIWYFDSSGRNGMTAEEQRNAAERKAKEEAKAAKEKSEKSSKKSSAGSSNVYTGGGLSSYDKGYDDVDINDEYDEYRYEHDLDYALGVDDAMEDRDEWY